MQETLGSIPGSGRSPGGGKWQPTPVFLTGELHEQRSMGVTIHEITKSDTTELKRLSMHTAIQSKEVTPHPAPL